MDKPGKGSGRKSCDQYSGLMKVGEDEIDRMTSVRTRISTRKALDVRQHRSRWMCALEAALEGGGGQRAGRGTCINLELERPMALPYP